MRVGEYGALTNSTDITNLLVDDLRIAMENTGGDASWLNGNNKQGSISIYNMFISGLLNSTQNENKWCCSA